MTRRLAFAITSVTLLASTAMADDKKPDDKKPAAAAKAKPKLSDEKAMKLATSAGPADITKGATIAVMGDDMKMKQLRAGTNGWMCMAAQMGSVVDSMCLDKNWQAWADAWMAKKDPPALTGIGVAYMLNGDNGASNTDPFAEAATADNKWVVTGPHVMILTPDTKMLDAMNTDWTGGGPWVMWKGTKYAHIMVPMGPMPKQPPTPKAK